MRPLATVEFLFLPAPPMHPTRPIEIRRAVPSDAAALSALMHSCSAYRGAYAAILQGYAIAPAQVERDLMHAACIGARILGFYSLAGLDTEPELDLMFVADAAQGTGMGKLLFDHMRATARGHGVREIRIVSHPPAEAFYLRMGAQRIGSILPGGRVTWPRPLLRLAVTP